MEKGDPYDDTMDSTYSDDEDFAEDEISAQESASDTEDEGNTLRQAVNDGFIYLCPDPECGWEVADGLCAGCGCTYTVSGTLIPFQSIYLPGGGSRSTHHRLDPHWTTKA